MPQKINHCFYQKLTFEKLLEAHLRARKHKTYKNEVILFELNLENNLINLLQNIRSKRYHLGSYRKFRIYEPKEREIEALPYVDRIVHQWYVEEFIKPYIVPKFIHTSFACLTERGTHKAVDNLQKQLRAYKRQVEDFWILKCDIKKYFYSIQPDILYSILGKYIRDEDLLDFTRLLIFENRPSSQPKGIPIGNYTSQFFANIYLNELDQFIKRTLKVRYYTRYMDDFVLLLPTKEDCKQTKKKIEDFLRTHLQLELNDKSKYYPCKMGVNFCGYRIFTTHRLLRLHSKKKIKRSVKHWNWQFQHGTLHIDKATQSLQSWLGHTSHCNAFHLQQKILQNCHFLLHNQTDARREEQFLQDMCTYQVPPDDLFFCDTDTPVTYLAPPTVYTEQENGQFRLF